MRATYNGARGSVNAGYSYDRGSERIDYGANGSIVAHADGVTLGQDITDAAVLVKAPGLDNVKLANDNTITHRLSWLRHRTLCHALSSHRYHPR
ncbi:putative fimbrial biogenesis outer membrane usher protein [Klebsiella quasipneumoniae]|nr:putative fimbrial biogenesis outer membrane usher protein [Klebsiella quasipneumoniae]